MLVLIKKEFIRRWIPDDSKNEFEQQYNKLKEKVKIEISKSKTLKEETFQEIYGWKTRNGSKRHLDSDLKIYTEAISKLLNEPSIEKKIETIAGLSGIRFPVASTVLHFVYPEDFPIIDVRTVKVLWDKGMLDRKLGDNIKDYITYREKIMKIKEICKEFSLRHIDRALFTYNEKKEALTRMIGEKKKINIYNVENKLKISHKLTKELINDLKNEFQDKLTILDNLKD